MAAPVQIYPFQQRMLLIAYQLVFYPAKVILPKMLSACYSSPLLVNGALAVEYYLAPLYLAVGVALVWLIGKKFNAVYYGPLVYLLTLSPVLQLIPFNNASLVADRYVYLPIVGLAFLLSQLVELAALKMSKHSFETIEIKNVLFGLLVLLLLIPSLQRINVWKNSLTLFDDVIQKNDHIGIAYGNRAETKIKRSDFAGLSPIVNNS